MSIAAHAITRERQPASVPLDMCPVGGPYFDPERPNITKAMHAAIKCMAADSVTRAGSRDALRLSTEALAFLWHSTASGEEAQWSGMKDWGAALEAMHWADRGGSLRYNRDWPVALAILQRTEIRELAKFAACFWWLHYMGGSEVPYDLRAAYARLFLPTYNGPGLRLYRGCIEGEELHCCWSTHKPVARQFARWNRGSPFARYGNRHIVRVHAPPKAIIWDTRPFMRKNSQHEIVVDPAMLGEIEVVETLPSNYRQRLVSPYFYKRKSFCKWGERLHAEAEEIQATSLPPEAVIAARIFRRICREMDTHVLSDALKAYPALNREKRIWEEQRVRDEERDLLMKMQRLAERDMTLEEIADEMDFCPEEIVEFAACESNPPAELASAIEVWRGE